MARDSLRANYGADSARAVPRWVEMMSGGIQIKNVSHVYLAAGGRSVVALDDISLEIGEREFVSLLGPSGCGKSTLLYLIGGFIPIEAGEIVVAGKPVTQPGPDRGIVFQHFALFPWKTVLQNVLYGLEKQRMPRVEREKRAWELLAAVKLKGFENAYPSQLSGGMKQRVAIARMLEVDPDVLLMDEPFGALDAQTRELMQEELLGIVRNTQKSVAFVTHDVREAVYLSDRVAVMSARPGRVREIVTIDRGGMTRSEFVRGARSAATIDYLWNQMRAEAIRSQNEIDG